MSTGQAKSIAMQLFTSTNNDDCTAVKDYVKTWLLSQDDNISLEIIPILEHPVRVIQAGINYTPALIVNGTVVSQNCSLEAVKAFLDSISSNLD